MTQSQKNSAKQIDYWSASNPNSLNDYDDGMSPVWTNHVTKNAEVLVRTSSIIVYKVAQSNTAYAFGNLNQWA